MGRAFEYRKAAKMKRWGNMSRVFPKLARAIEVAAKTGVPDPEMNSALRTAILNAKAENMPKANIDAAIKRATGKDSANFSEVNFEGKGPHGVLVFVETATDNNTRTVANIKMHFNKTGGQVVPTGSLEFFFDRKAIFEFTKPTNWELEELELELIDAGLEELEEEDGLCLAYANYTDFGNMNNKFEELKIPLIKAELKRIPNNPQEFSEEQQEDIGKLIEKLEDDDDVQAVYTNIA
ncbi:YebC/PmpR family DNA-binding transcriptional regulator [Aliarcobacter skirrowii]|uniref:YebC/PmpR family DNA-binding transcriptional regulator n=1 Tax=Aliarcobacter skirrowii TaxID=28200 RepID=UPI000D621E92|nr:YebC/PmpR family DNA-binding transcriptional regulator [Aliarcobacter skirrowii]PWE21852.1 YebC/PmpR family DNA-binding transcriptional regulator [Aliarcobacter skirrowii]PWE25418.1 YebC/PmpR family DNA-binding transcriptional regulator [Aliarcobacter skirrowii]RJO56185.1 YebC/PmpR family DNA-binding transcriptional regulator [Aliarcobacter skirrowii]RJO58140.1 YebC/PmpR family DNA-binding transcriptional regulator [Aliarcobacter skirrowii]